MAKSLDTMISDLISLWMNWIQSDKKVRDISIDISERRKAAQECENLIGQKYLLIQEIDNYFDGILKRT